MMDESHPSKKCRYSEDTRDENELGAAILGSLCVYICKYGTLHQSSQVRKYMDALFAKEGEQNEEKEIIPAVKRTKNIVSEISSNNKQKKDDNLQDKMENEREFDCHELRQQLYDMIDADDFLWDHAVNYCRVMVAPQMSIPSDQLDKVFQISRQTRKPRSYKNGNIFDNERIGGEVPKKNEYFESFPTSLEWLCHVPEKFKTPDLVIKTTTYQEIKKKDNNKPNKRQKATACGRKDSKNLPTSSKVKTVEKNTENFQNTLTSMDKSETNTPLSSPERLQAKGKELKRYATRGSPKKSQIVHKIDDLDSNHLTSDSSEIEDGSTEKSLNLSESTAQKSSCNFSAKKIKLTTTQQTKFESRQLKRGMSRPLTSPYSGVFCRRKKEKEANSMSLNNSSITPWNAQTQMRSTSNHLHFFCGKYETEIEAAYAVDLMRTFINPEHSDKNFQSKEADSKDQINPNNFQLNVSTIEECEEAWRPYLKEYGHLRSVAVIDVKMRPILRKIVSEFVKIWAKKKGYGSFEKVDDVQYSRDKDSPKK